jgi:hypothetical protein
MKKFIAVLLSLAMLVTLGSTAVFADNGTTNTEQTPAPSASPEPSATPEPDNNDEAGITPDSPLYPIERLIESVQVALTFSADGKAELLVSFANERLSEAEIMTEENKQYMVKKVMEAYVKTVRRAAEKADEAAQSDKDVGAILEEIKIVEETAEKIVIKATGVIPAEVAESLKAAITGEVKKTLAVQTFAVAKENFFDAAKEYKLAKDELKNARESGDATLITAAEEKLLLAEEYKDEMEQIKDQIEDYKEQIKKDVETSLKDEDENDDADIGEDKGNYERNLEKKIEKLEELIEKQTAKREELVNKLKDRPGKAAAKIEENTKKQMEKKTEKVNSLKGQSSTQNEQSTTQEESSSTTQEESSSTVQQEASGSAITTAQQPKANTSAAVQHKDNGKSKSKNGKD